MKKDEFIKIAEPLIGKFVKFKYDDTDHVGTIYSTIDKNDKDYDSGCIQISGIDRDGYSVDLNTSECSGIEDIVKL